MLNRILQKQYLLWLAALVGAFHLVLAPLRFFVPYHTLDIIDYILLGLTAAGWIVYAARRKGGIPLQGEQTLLICYLIWFLLSCVSMTVVHQRDWVNYNITSLLDVAAALLLFFPLGNALAREKTPKGMTALLHVILLGWSLFILCVLITVFQGNTITTPNGGILGMEKSPYALQLNNHYNMVGSWEIPIFLGCFIMAIRSKKPILKAIYVVCILIHYVAIVLTNSRTAFVAALPGCAAMTGLALYLHFKKQPGLRRWLITLAGAILVGAVYYFLRDRLFILLRTATAIPSTAEEAINAAPAVSSEARDLVAADISSLNARTWLWKWALQGVVSTPQRFIFGVTPASIGSLIQLMSEGQWKYNSYTHNQIIEVLADTGVVGLCIFGAWLFLLARNMYRLVFVQKNRTALLSLPIIILCMLLANMAEAFLLFYSSWVGYIFFFLCGFLHGSVNGPAKELTEQRIRNIKLLKRIA